MKFNQWHRYISFIISNNCGMSRKKLYYINNYRTINVNKYLFLVALLEKKGNSFRNLLFY